MSMFPTVTNLSNPSNRYSVRNQIIEGTVDRGRHDGLIDPTGRKLWYANNRWWLFFTNETGLMYYYRYISSPDGINWESVDGDERHGMLIYLLFHPLIINNTTLIHSYSTPDRDKECWGNLDVYLLNLPMPDKNFLIKVNPELINVNFKISDDKQIKLIKFYPILAFGERDVVELHFQ